VFSLDTLLHTKASLLSCLLQREVLTTHADLENVCCQPPNLPEDPELDLLQCMGPWAGHRLSQQHSQGIQQLSGVCLTVQLALSHAASRHHAAWLCCRVTCTL